MATMYCDEWHLRLWSGFYDAVRSGHSAAERLFGGDVFAYLSAHPDQERTFDQAMSNLSAPYNAAVAAICDCSGVSTLVDVGGGEGSLLVTLLRSNPSLRGVLYDREPVIERARARLGEAGMGERCNLAAGDFFESVPAGGDAYIIKNVLHDWDDERATRLLSNCRAVMAPEARLWIVEMIIPPGNNPVLGKLLDMHMLLIGGRNRTESDFRVLLGSAGFRLNRIIPTAAPVSVVEALPLV